MGARLAAVAQIGETLPGRGLDQAVIAACAVLSGHLAFDMLVPEWLCPMVVTRRYFSMFAAAACAGFAKAQDATTFSADVRVVNLFATVHDSQGHVVRNLTKDDFTLEEDGRPQTIRYFSQESGLPLTVGLLIDTSLSQRRVLGEERSASHRFLSQVLRPDKDRAFVIHVDREVELLQDLTSSRQKLDDALAELETPTRGQRSGGGRRGGPDAGRWRGGGTQLYDSVLLASDELMRKLPGRKALILLTDGVDTGSKVSLVRAIESAQRADALAYSILFSDPEMQSGRRRDYHSRYSGVDGKQILQRLSRETGGSFFEVSDSRPISTIYTQLEEELRNQYSVGYSSDQAEAGLGYRKIHLAAKQPGLLVETRDGYYAK
jgi:VWFA-related protein